MSKERWFTDRRWHEGRGVEGLERAIPKLVRVSLASGTTGTVTTIDHNLGRIPQSMSIVNIYYNLGASRGTEVWYRTDGDAAWDERQLDARFDFDDCEILVEIT